MNTTDRDDPRLKQIRPDGQQEAYLILSDAERAKGFVRPYRDAYRHLACGSVTTMGTALSETYAATPHFYGGTFCCWCRKHFHLRDYRTPELQATDGWAFVWTADGEPVGSDAAEAAEWNAARAAREADKYKGAGI